MTLNKQIKILLIILYSTTQQTMSNVLPYLSFRSASVNAARELVGWQTEINKANMDTCYGVFSITPEYLRSFQGSHIAQSLFCGSLFERTCSRPNLAFKIQGSQVRNRDNQAWLADYFYLPTDFSSIINIDPKIDTFLVDFNIYVGFDTWAPGLFFRTHAPMVNSRWDLRFCESNITPGTNGYAPGYFNDMYTTNTTSKTIVGIPRDELLASFEDFVFAQDSITDSQTITYEPLRNARMSTFRLTKSRLAEIQLACGYNFLLNPDYHLGLELRGSIPTGNRPHGEFLFEAIVGNGHHAELGLGLTSHYTFWNDECQQRSLALYCDANITHLFKSCQRRTFDLRNKPLSRYMLAMDMRPPTENLIATINGADIVPTRQLKNRFTPVANITTIPVEVSYRIQADIALKLAFITENVQWDIGYDFWYRSIENICKKSDKCCLNKMSKSWALKGDSFVFGFPEITPTNISTFGVPLAVSESKATIFNGTNSYWPIGTSNQNPGIDTPMGLASNTINQHLVTTQQLTLPVTWNQVNISANPLVIQEEDLDINGARAKGLSNKIFTHINYTFNCCKPWKPYLGIGGEVEFGYSEPGCCWDSLSQWGLWIKGGLIFDSSKTC